MIKQTYLKVSLCGFIAAAYSPSCYFLFIRLIFCSVFFAFCVCVCECVLFTVVRSHFFFSFSLSSYIIEAKYKESQMLAPSPFELLSLSPPFFFRRCALFSLHLFANIPHTFEFVRRRRKMSYFNCDTLDKQCREGRSERERGKKRKNNVCLTVYCGILLIIFHWLCWFYNCKML